MSAAACRVDLHVKVLDDRVVRRAKAQGLDALVYAPHFRRLPAIEREAAAYSDDDLEIIPAREVFTGSWRNRKHVLALDLAAPVPDFITLEGAMSAFADQEAVVLVPHPEFATVSLTAADLRQYQQQIDAIETYNPKHLAYHNRRATILAERTGVPKFTSSYAHLRHTVGEAWTTFPGIEPRIETIIDALRTGTQRHIEYRAGLSHRLRCLAEIAHLGWENSWKKFDRVILHDIEATHPRHPAYEGRFDDVAVY
ncbi:MAG: PHP-associated domain-containing protein [Halobacteriales archaeon]